MGEMTRLVFVALGDSLTRGYVPYRSTGPFHHSLPYTDALDNIVIVEQGKKGYENVDCIFINRGVDGDSTKGMLSRLTSELPGLNPDYVIVWGGLNDVFMGRQPAEVMETLRQIYQKTFEIGATPIACTLTSVRGASPVVQRIQELNESIKAHSDLKGIMLADLYATTSDMEGRLLSWYSSDGAHLNMEGNRVVASTIYAEVVDGILDEYAQKR
jgi:lysophospholipase L1-like esterase